MSTKSDAPVASDLPPRTRTKEEFASLQAECRYSGLGKSKVRFHTRESFSKSQQSLMALEGDDRPPLSRTPRLPRSVIWKHIRLDGPPLGCIFR